MTARLTIDRLGKRGCGVASYQGTEIEVPFTLPGEVVEGRVDGTLLTETHIVTASPHRVTPACRHFKSCGGCALQHADDHLVAHWKEEQVRASLSQQGLTTDFKPQAISPAFSRRRAQFSARRGKKAAQVGFHMRRSDLLIDLFECPVLDQRITNALPALREITQRGASRKAELRLSVTVSENGLDVSVDGAKTLSPQDQESLAGLAHDHGFGRLFWNGQQIALIDPPYQTFGTAHVIPPPDSFLQATPQGQSALVQAVVTALGQPSSVIDLFAGCGTFSLPVAQNSAVHAVEADRHMLQSLADGWRMTQSLKRVSTEQRDLFRNPVLASELNQFDAGIIDPPRAGALAQVKELAKSDIGLLAFVSCNPTSFARDAKVLVDAGFRLNWVQVIDQFRWSVHTELAAQFCRQSV